MNLAAWSTRGDRADLAGVERTLVGSETSPALHAPRLAPHQLLPALRRAEGPWWAGWGWRNLVDDPANQREPAVTVLRTFAARIAAGDDPVSFLGGVEPEDAVAAVTDWTYWAVPVEAIEGWLAAGCWSARVVRSLVDRGLGPDVFYDEDGDLLAFEDERLAPYSLASYVMDGTVAVAAVELEAQRLRCAGA